MELTDITGKLIYSTEINFDNLIGKLNLNVENGIYFVKIIDIKNKKQFVQKIIINILGSIIHSKQFASETTVMICK